MWRPGFEFAERTPARLSGLHRALCVYSFVHRGTSDCPGLVLGLDRGGSCQGVAFRVAGPRAEETVAYLREREQVTMIYRETNRRIALGDGSGRMVDALTYVVDRDHAQYAGELPLDRQLACVRQGRGRSGPNIEYVVNTVAHLREMGIRDARLESLAGALDRLGPALSGGDAAAPGPAARG